MSTSPAGYVTPGEATFGEAGVPTTGLEGGVGYNLRVTLTERCEIWGRGPFVSVLKFDSPLPEAHQVNTLSTADSLRHH